ncbi:hypothetical protein [Moorena producens]|uniref:hypothetical protein n=1 Tax=Moorena producens TaxID=1155739 RepID=UPI003C76DFD0
MKSIDYLPYHSQSYRQLSANALLYMLLEVLSANCENFVPYSLLPTPYSLLPTPYSLLPVLFKITLNDYY